MNKVTLENIKQAKVQNKKLTMLTAYDYPMGQWVDASGVDMVLVGDSLANVVLGLESTRDVGMMEMIHHCKAVRRGVERAFLIGDMPYESYQKNSSNAVENAHRFINEAGCDAVKLEWFEGCLDVAKAIVDDGIAVMGHVGLTPQTAEQLGGFKVQGRDAESALTILKSAVALQDVGCFSVVLECVPKELGSLISEKLHIPTVGIGAGVGCDGQVLVTHDVLGMYDRFQPKFSRRYTKVSESVQEALQNYCVDVRESRFPSEKESFHILPEQWDELLKSFDVS